MPWVLGWPLDSDYAVKLARDLNLIKRPNPRESEYFVAGANYIATQARWEHVLNCWVNGSIDLVFGVYVDDRARQHHPKRIVMSRMTPLSKWYKLAKYLPIKSKPEWYRYQDCSYNPWEGEKWSGTYRGEDDELVDYVDESYEDEGDSSEWVSEDEGEVDEHTESDDPESDQDTERDTASVSMTPPPEQGGGVANTLAPQLEVQCVI